MLHPWRHLADWNKAFYVADDKFKEVMDEALRRTEFAKERRIVLRDTTAYAVAKIPDGTLDRCYIDGDHTLRCSDFSGQSNSIFSKEQKGPSNGPDEGKEDQVQHWGVVSQMPDPSPACLQSAVRFVGSYRSSWVSGWEDSPPSTTDLVGANRYSEPCHFGRPPPPFSREKIPSPLIDFRSLFVVWTKGLWAMLIVTVARCVTPNYRPPHLVAVSPRNARPFQINLVFQSRWPTTCVCLYPCHLAP